MSHTGAFRALAVYLDRMPRCTDHPGCVLRPGHDGPPMPAPVVRLSVNALANIEEEQ